ncbi:hypothetical protein Q8A73_002487 [Channa argus]|nr:hypothetical protein Q8A73_002487 [Channa argus]
MVEDSLAAGAFLNFPRTPLRPYISGRTTRPRGRGVSRSHTPRLSQCIIYERNFSNSSTGYGSRFEEWADRSAQSGGSRRSGARRVLGAKDGCRRREQVFEDRVASRSSGDACKLSAVCGNAFTSCPVRFGRRR